jgi:hypothetical protein
VPNIGWCGVAGRPAAAVAVADWCCEAAIRRDEGRDKKFGGTRDEEEGRDKREIPHTGYDKIMSDIKERFLGGKFEHFFKLILLKVSIDG